MRGEEQPRPEQARADGTGEQSEEAPVCQCCTFGNHCIICTCDGEGCCHPEEYKEYNPAWGHAPLKAKPAEKMRIYLAGKWESAPILREKREALRALGHTVTSSWLDRHALLGDDAAPTPSLATNPEVGAHYASLDMADITNSQALVGCTIGGGVRGGRHVELGMALAWGKEIFLVGPREHVFHALPQVLVFPDWPELLEFLGSR